MTKKGKHRVFPKDGEDKLKEKIQKLKSRIRNLEKINKRLVSENNQLRTVFDKNIDRVKELTDKKKLSEVLEMKNELREESLTEKDLIRLKFAKQYSGKNNE